MWAQQCNRGCAPASHLRCLPFHQPFHSMHGQNHAAVLTIVAAGAKLRHCMLLKRGNAHAVSCFCNMLPPRRLCLPTQVGSMLLPFNLKRPARKCAAKTVPFPLFPLQKDITPCACGRVVTTHARSALLACCPGYNTNGNARSTATTTRVALCCRACPLFAAVMLLMGALAPRVSGVAPRPY